MGKLVIRDECLIPRRLGWLNYKGPDPTGFLKNFRKTLRFQFDVSTTRCYERKLLWDYTGDPIRFYNEWIVKKEVSRFSNIWFTLRALGYVSKAKNDGDFSLELYGDVEHTFKPSNWFTKYVWLLYNYLFYNKLRESYTVMCRDYLNNFTNWCKEKYGMMVVTSPESTLEQILHDQETEKIKQMAERGRKAHVKETRAKEQEESSEEEHQ